MTTQLEIQCEACGVHLTVDADVKTVTCPYCDSPSVVERPPAPDRPDPTFVVPFVLEGGLARERVQRWIKRRGLFAHGGLKQASLDKTRGVYLPAYLYGAIAESGFSAEIGEEYQETETYTTTDSKGNTVTRTRTVTRTEWRNLAGDHAGYVLDVIVTASRGVDNGQLEHIEPFDLRALRRYEPKFISGWPAEEPSLARDDCLAMAHDESVQEIGNRLAGFMPGDSYRNLRHSTSLHDEVVDLVLLPVWIFALRYHAEKPPARVLVNGQTGEVWGEVPLSPLKITIAVVLGLLLVGALVLWVASQ